MIIRSLPMQTWLILMFFSFGVLTLGQYIGDRIGLFVSFIIICLIHLFLFTYGETRSLLKGLPARKLKGQDPWMARLELSELAQQAGIEAPSCFLIESSDPWAFSVQSSKGDNTCAFSIGLLSKLTLSERSALFAYLIAHLRVSNHLKFCFISGVLRFFLGLAQAVDSVWPTNWRRKTDLNKTKVLPFTRIFEMITSFFLKLTIRRSVFFETDSMASQLVNNPRDLASVLWKLHGLSISMPHPVPPSSEHHFIVDPRGIYRPILTFNQQPPIHLRIRRLIGTDTV